MADKDGLTGLSLRTEFDEALSNAKQSETAIVYFDVNNLKYTNDNFGHSAGDKLLTTCVEALKSNFREKEIFRTGGDEFIVILEGVGPTLIEKKLKSVKDILDKKTKEDADGIIYQIAAGFHVGDGILSKQEIMEKAESKMYINKKELKKTSTIRDSRNDIREQSPFREVTIRKPIEFPEDINENDEEIETTYVSCLRETIVKIIVIGLGFISVGVYLMLFA